MDTNRDNDGYIISVQDLIDDATSRSDAEPDRRKPPGQKSTPVKK